MRSAVYMSKIFLVTDPGDLLLHFDQRQSVRELVLVQHLPAWLTHYFRHLLQLQVLLCVRRVSS